MKCLQDLSRWAALKIEIYRFAFSLNVSEIAEIIHPHYLASIYLCRKLKSRDITVHLFQRTFLIGILMMPRLAPKIPICYLC